MATQFKFATIITFVVGVQLSSSALASTIKPSGTATRQLCQTCTAENKLPVAKPSVNENVKPDRGFIPPSNSTPQITQGSGSR